MYGPHQRRAERAVEADRERPRVAHRVPERFGRLAGQRAARRIGDRARDDHRQPRAALARTASSIANSAAFAFSVSNTVSTSSRSTPPSTRPSTASRYAFDELVERDVARAGIVDVGRDRRGAVGRAERAGDEARPVGRLRRPARPRARARSRAAARLISCTRASGRSRPARSTSRVNVLVSTMSAPAAKYASWIARTTSGCVSDSRSLSPLRSCAWCVSRTQPARGSPPRESGAPGSSCPSRRRGPGCDGRGAR